MDSKNNITCKPLTPDLWSDLELLFGKSGAYWGCWCMYWRCSNKEFENMKSTDRKQALKKTVSNGKHVPGILAYLDNKPVGWVALSPRDEYPRLTNSRVIKPFDDQPVWSIVCFFIHKEYRGIGITKVLLTAAEDYALLQGASILESYPIDSNDRIADELAYVGSRYLFEQAGFKKITDTKATSGGEKKIMMRKSI